MKIGIIGSTGLLGQPVTREFLASGQEVRLLARSPEAVRRLYGDQPEVFRGDLEAPSTLPDFLRGLDAVYLNLSVRPEEKPNDFHTEGKGLENVIEAAAQAGRPRLMLLSSLVMNYQGMNGFDWWAFRLKQEAVRKVKASGCPYSIFYPSSFMENIDRGAMRAGSTLQLAGRSEQPMYFIAGKDYGRQVVRSLPLPGNHEFTIQGPEAHNWDDAAAIFMKHYSKSKLTLRRAPISVIRLAGKFSAKFSYAYHILEALNRYPEKFAAGETWKQLGRPEITLESYARSEAV